MKKLRRRFEKAADHLEDACKKQGAFKRMYNMVGKWRRGEALTQAEFDGIPFRVRQWLPDFGGKISDNEWERFRERADDYSMAIGLAIAECNEEIGAVESGIDFDADFE